MPSTQRSARSKMSEVRKLIARRGKTWAPLARRFARAAPAAERAWQAQIAAAVTQHEARRQQAGAWAREGMSSILRGLTVDERYRKGLELFGQGLDSFTLDPEPTVHSVLARHEGLLTMAGDRLLLDRIMPLEESIDVFGPPYAGQGTDLRGGPHQQHQASADRTTGRFSFLHTIGKEGGFSYAAAAIWVHFMRRSPGSPPGQGKPGIAQMRPYVPYDYAWRDTSYIATAHSHAGFGVFVSSEDLAGGDHRVDQNHQYWIFSDGTSWYDDHSNPAFPGTDHDHALNFGNQAPWFSILPGRIYSAAVWCLGECDAHGATIESASYAQAAIVARMPFLVIAQSKN